MTGNPQLKPDRKLHEAGKAHDCSAGVAETSVAKEYSTSKIPHLMVQLLKLKTTPLGRPCHELKSGMEQIKTWALIFKSAYLRGLNLYGQTIFSISFKF